MKYRRYKGHVILNPRRGVWLAFDSIDKAARFHLGFKVTPSTTSRTLAGLKKNITSLLEGTTKSSSRDLMRERWFISGYNIPYPHCLCRRPAVDSKDMCGYCGCSTIPEKVRSSVGRTRKIVSMKGVSLPPIEWRLK